MQENHTFNALTRATFSETWIIEVLFGILILLFTHFGLKPLLHYFKRRFLSKSQEMKGSFSNILYLPLKVILWIFGISYLIEVLASTFELQSIINYLKPLRNALVVVLLGWLALKWKKEFFLSSKTRSYFEKKKIDFTVLSILEKMATIVILAMTGMIALQMIGLNMLPLVAFGSIGAAALGFAGKDVMANFFGGLMLHMTHPFSKGDLIAIPQQQIEGNIEEIGWFLTCIRDKDKRSAYLPNSMFSSVLLINLSRMSHRRIETTIGIRYEDVEKIQEVTEEIRKEISRHPNIDTSLPVIVAFNRFNEYALDIYIDAYCTVTAYRNFLAVKQELFLKIQNILKRYQIEMPFPITSLYFPQKLKISRDGL